MSVPVLKPRRRIRLSRDRLAGAPVRTPTVLCAYGVDGVLVAVSSRDLTELWRRPLDKEYPFSESLEIDVVPVSGLGGRLGAFDAGGERLWTRRDEGQRMAATWRRHVLALTGRTLTYIEASTGAVSGEPMELPFEGSCIVVWGDLAIVTAIEGDLFCGVDLPSRRIAWSRPVRAELTARFGVSDPGRSLRSTRGTGKPFVGCLWQSNCLIALDVETGEPLWSRPAWLNDGLHGVFDGHVYYWPWTPREGNHIVSLDQRTGEVDYDVDLRTVGEGFNAPCFPWSPVVVGDALLFTTRDGIAVVVGRADGAVRSICRYKYPLNAPTALGTDMLVTAGDGHLLVFEPG